MYNITVFITRIVWAVYVELYNCEELVESIVLVHQKYEKLAYRL